MTQEREIEIEGRLTALETTVAEIRELLKSRSASWQQLLLTVVSGAAVALLVHYIG